jgi:hypothetical protein
MQLKILYHGNCFDGCASAALFGRFFVEREGSRLRAVSYSPLHHQQGDAFPPGAFDADVNACVDFRFSPSANLHWWFDHHASAFVTSADRAAFEREASHQKFWDPAAPSCTGFIARTLAERFDWTAPELDELVRWADVIDAARFPSAAMAVALEEPALRIMALLEATKDPQLPTRVIEAMQHRALADIAAEPWAATPLGPILERHRAAIETVRRRAHVEGGVVTVDLADSGVEGGSNKFIAYDLFPDARYTVTVTRDPKRAKVSVGSNPWARPARAHDIAKLCERYGGGGHAVVGAVSLKGDQVDDARRIAAEIARALRAEPSAP